MTIALLIATIFLQFFVISKLNKLLRRVEINRQDIAELRSTLLTRAFTKQDVTVYPIKAAEMKPAAPEEPKWTVTVRNSAGKLIDVYEVPGSFAGFKL